MKTAIQRNGGKGNMAQTISFPGLGLNFNIDPVAFYLPAFLGGRGIKWYGIIIALGLLAGVLYFFARTKEFAVDPDRSTDVLLVAIICAVIGARLYYVLFSWADYQDNPIRALYIWEGGLAIYGCIIAAILSAMLMCRIRKVRFLPLMDLASASLLLGQAIGRWGNFTNVEAFGSNTSAPWGMKALSTTWYLTERKADLAKIGMIVDPDMPVHPTFLYESLWCMAGFLLIMWFTKRRRFDGQLTLIYLGWYGLGRFFIEGLRTDSLLLGTIRISQFLAIICVLFAVAGIFMILSKIRREGDPDYLRLYRDTEEGKLVLAGEFYKKPGNETAAEEITADEEIESVSEEDEESAQEVTVVETAEADTEKEEPNGDSD